MTEKQLKPHLESSDNHTTTAGASAPAFINTTMTQPNTHRYYRCQHSLSAYHVRPDGSMAIYTMYPNSGTAEMQFYTSDCLLDILQEINDPAIAITSDEFTAHKWRVIEFLRAKEVMP